MPKFTVSNYKKTVLFTVKSSIPIQGAILYRINIDYSEDILEPWSLEKWKGWNFIYSRKFFKRIEGLSESLGRKVELISRKTFALNLQTFWKTTKPVTEAAIFVEF